YSGGYSNVGTVFKLNTDGTGYTVLKSFTGNPDDGANPYGGVALSGSLLYGTTRNGGSSEAGTVFEMNTDGTGYTVLYSFTGFPDGAGPLAGLTLSSGVLYGTTGFGGTSGYGTVFTLNTDGTGYAVLYSFTGVGNDGANPYAGLTLSGSVLYGTTEFAGGTVFKLNTDGTGYAVLHYFYTGEPYGVNPYGGVTLS